MSESASVNPLQFLTFTLGEEVFALEIGRVREVMDFTTVTKVPRTPDYLRGVINLRGLVVPVVDLRLKLGMTRTEKSVNTCVIIIEVVVDDETVIVGAMADSVQEVLTLEPQQIEPPPRIGTRLNTDIIKGMGKCEDHFVIILDMDRSFSTDDLQLFAAAEGEDLAVNE